MDSSDSHDSSDSASPSRSPSPKRRHASNGLAEDASKAVSCIRFLVSNSAAGSVIGKGGATISEFQSQSGCKIQLSRNHEYYPGTNDRIISLNGTISEMLTALNLILSKLFNEAEDDSDVDQKTNQVRLIVPNSVCGAIIGKGGATIKSFVEESQANIKLSSQDQAVPGTGDRLVTVIGTLEQLSHAVSLIITKLSEDRYYAQFANSPLSYTVASLSGLQGFPGGYVASPGASIGYGLTTYGSSAAGSNIRNQGLMPQMVGMRSSFPGAVPLLQSGRQTTATIAVPDEHVGAIVGRGGRVITEIQQASGANIKISDRGDFLSGTNDRKVTITGSAECIRVAKRMLKQKVEQSVSSEFER